MTSILRRDRTFAYTSIEFLKDRALFTYYVGPLAGVRDGRLSPKPCRSIGFTGERMRVTLGEGNTPLVPSVHIGPRYGAAGLLFSWRTVIHQA